MTGDSESKPQPLSWTVNPRERDPKKVTVVVVVALITAVVVFLVSKSLLLGILAVVAIMGATAEFWIGSKYSLTDQDATAKIGWNWQGMKWQEVKSVAIFDESLKLSPFDTESRLESIRGITLTFPPELRAEIIEYVKTRIDPDARVLER